MSEAPIELSYEVTQEDLVAFYLWNAGRNGHLRQSMRFVGGLGILFITVESVLHLVFGVHPNTVFLVDGILAAALWLLLATMPRHGRKSYEALAKSLKPPLPYRYVLRADGAGVSSTGPSTELLFLPWSRLDEPLRVDQHLFLPYGKAGAHVVPRRVFAGRDDEDAFIRGYNALRIGATPG